jgi:TolB-like protein
MNFLAELKRRNVIRAGVLYIGAVWALAQGVSQLGPSVGAPEWATRWFLVSAAIGFPFFLAFAWFFEFTPEGLKLESQIDPADSITQHTSKKLDRWIIAVLALAVVLLLTDHFVSRREADKAVPTAVVPAVVATDDKSIAVLPFVNMSGDAANEYFSDGITEEILNALAQIPDLKVAARTSAFAFKGKQPDLRKVGEVLDVATVLEGSVQRAGDAVRITAQLIDTRSGYHLWSEKYDRTLTNVFAIEDEISKAIADKLKVQFAGAHADAGNTANTQAHELYLRGLSLLAARGLGLRDAAVAFSKAVELDPKYAQAWGALAETEQLLPVYTGGDLDAGMARAESAAQRALSVDPDTASALVAIANVHAHRIEWAQAEKMFQRALVLAPGDVEVLDQYAQFLSEVGQFEPALAQIDRARQLDPLSAIVGVVRGTILMGLHRDADATSQIESVLAAHPDFYPACMTAVLLYSSLGRHADAEQQLRAVARHLGVDPEAMAVLARGIADHGARAAALSSLNSAPANANIRGDSLLYAAFLTLLGDHDRALAQLAVFAARNDAAAGVLLWTRTFDPLRSDPRYKALLQKMNLPYQSPAGSAP